MPTPTPDRVAVRGPHTPGPWQIFDPSGLSENVLIAFVEHDADDDGRHRSCLLRVCEMADTQDEYANADLIAASPDLLAALRALMSAVEGMGVREVILAKCDRAIARATGAA